MRRLMIATTAVLTVAAALTGCTSSTPDQVRTATKTASTTPAPKAAVTSTPTATPKAVETPATAPAPAVTEAAVTDPTAAEPPTTAAPAPTRSALAQHVHDQCNVGAADAGVRLVFTEHPSGYTSDDRYLLIYPFAFLDGHSDPYAMYNCALTDDTVTSTFLGGGLTDSH
jgi:hypothetical protein